MQKLRRGLVSTIIFSLSFGQLLSFPAALAQTELEPIATSEPPAAQVATPSELPEVNWSEVDWDSNLVLLEDWEAYSQQKHELAKNGEAAAAAALQPTKTPLTSNKVLDSWHAPKQVKELVKQYRETIKTITNQTLKTEARLELVNKLKALAPEQPNGISSLNQPAELVDVKSLKPVGGSLVWSKAPKKSVVFKNSKITPANHILELPGLSLTAQIKKAKEKNELANRPRASLWKKVRGFIEGLTLVTPVNAATPIIAYYNGIEQNTLDYALYYLSESQNPDGSFGSDQHFENTLAVVSLLQDIAKTNNDQYSSAVNYLLTAGPTNNRETALKIRALVANGQGEVAQELVGELLTSQNPDGGFGYTADYASDLHTTTEVLLAVQASSGTSSNNFIAALSYTLQNIPPNGELRYTTDSDPSFYLINKVAQNLGPVSGLGVTNNGQTITVNSRLEYLLNFLTLYYDSATQTLVGSAGVQDEIMTAKTWQLYGLAESALSKLRPEIIRQRRGNGSWENSPLITVAGVAAVALEDWEVVKVDVVGILEHGQPAEFKLTLKNVGYRISRSAFLNIVAEGLLLNENVDFAANNLFVAPGGQLEINLVIHDTRAYELNTPFAFFVDSNTDLNENNNWHNKDYVFNLSSVGGLPEMPSFYVAHYSSFFNEPAINVRWAMGQSDSLTTNYVTLLRKKGETNWVEYLAPKTANGAFFSNLENGATYEITTGVITNTDANTRTVFSDITEVTFGLNQSNYQGRIKGKVGTLLSTFSNTIFEGYGLVGESDFAGNFIVNEVGNGQTAARLNPVESSGLDVIWTKFKVSSHTTTTVNIPTRYLPDRQAPTLTNLRVVGESDLALLAGREVIIEAKATDNVMSKEVDLYYFSPSDNAWIYLASQNFSSDGTARYNWFLGELIGPNYKLKAIARDFRGNESISLEWGPFRISDGVEPTINIITPAAGATWTLGSSAEITWHATGQNGVANVEINLNYQNGLSENLVATAPNTGLYAWTIPNESKYLGTGVTVAIVVKDALSGEPASIKSGSFNIIDNSTPLNKPWAEAVFVPNELESSNYARKNNVVLKYSAAGVGHLIYHYAEDTLATNPRIILNQLWHRSFQNGVWSAAEKIFEERIETDSSLSNYPNLKQMRMVVDKNDNPAVIYLREQLGVGGCTDFNNSDIYFLGFNGNAWIGPTNLSNSGAESADHTLADSPSGNIEVAWRDGLIWNEACLPAGTSDLRHVAGGTIGWGAVNIFNPEGTGLIADPRLEVTTNNRSHIVYQTNEGVMKHIFKDNNSWSAPTEFSRGRYFNGELVAGLNNSLHYVTKEYLAPSGYQIVYLYNDGNLNWQPKEIVTNVTTIKDPYYPKLVVDNNNTPYVLAQNVTIENEGLYWTTKYLNGNWKLAERANLDTQTVDKEHFDLAYNARDNIMGATFISNYSLRKEVVYNQADLSINLQTPLPVENLQAVGGVEQITLTWDPYINEFGSFHSFTIYRSPTPTNSLAGTTTVAAEFDVNTTSYTDLTAEPNRAYYYYIIVSSVGAGRSPLGEFVGPAVAIAAPAVLPLPVENFAAMGGVEQIELSWNKYNNVQNDFGSYAIYRSTTPISSTTGLTPTFYIGGINVTSFTDSWAKINTDYYYIIKVISPSGQPGSDSGLVGPVAASPAPDIPLPVTNIQATGGEKIIVTWDRYNNTRSDFAYYAVFRSEVPTSTTANTQLQATISDIATTTYLEDPVPFNKDYYYYVAAINSTGLAGPDGQFVGPVQLIKPIVVTQIETIVYEDAEDGATNGWRIRNKSSMGTVSNIMEGGEQGRVISLAKKHRQARFEYNPGSWQFPEYSAFSWDTKISTDVEFVIEVETTAGSKLLSYSTANNNALNDKGAAFKLDTAIKDGHWHSITRQLQKDVESVGATYTITSINLFKVMDSARIDNIKLIKGLNGNTDPNPDPDPQPDPEPGPDPQPDPDPDPTTSPIVYEDAEDGTINGWKMTPKRGGDISNTIADQEHSRVITFRAKNSKTKFSFIPASPWQYPTLTTFNLELEATSDVGFRILVNTTDGTKTLEFATNNLTRLNGSTLEFALGNEFKSGVWQSLSLNLQTELEKLLSGITILEITGFNTFGSGMIDNISLSK